uniref:HTH CENPB-type domain-containing protein n=1 Tax=Strongyloides venezuelensis TaxID=75913 RepID=A0A0K0EZ04_STRVS
MKRPHNDLLHGAPVSGSLLYEKVLEFNTKISCDSSFKVSIGWLEKFKSRHESFKDEFENNLEVIGYNLEFFYNADETGIYWKALQSKSLAPRHE